MSCLCSRATVWVIGERVSGVPTRAELGAKVGGIGERVSGVSGRGNDLITGRVVFLVEETGKFAVARHSR